MRKRDPQLAEGWGQIVTPPRYIMYQTWSDMTAREYKRIKGLKKENLRDNGRENRQVRNFSIECKGRPADE